MASHAQPLSADALPRAVGARRGLRVCHSVSGDLWAGAEVQVATVASYLVERPDVNLSAVLLNEGRLASELRGLGVQVTVIDESRNSAVRIVALLTRYLREHHVEVVHTHRYKESVRSEEHTSELQSQSNLVCRLLLEKKKKSRYNDKVPDVTWMPILDLAHLIEH